MAEALQGLGGYLAQDIWSQETLATYLAETDLRSERIPATANEMWAVSAPLLDYDSGAAPDMQTMTVLGVNETVRNAGPLAQELSIKLSSATQMRQLSITDPYNMILARMVDVIPSSATTPHRDGERFYRLTYGLIAETRGQGAYAAPRAIFPAEQHALSFEQRLPELNQAPRLFHPMFVSALEDEAKAKLFVQALAAGLIHTDYGREVETIVVDTARGTYPLSAEADRSYHRVSPLLLAMLRFVAASEDVLRGVEAALRGLPDREQRWLAFVREELPGMYQLTEEGAADVVALTDLVLYDLLEGRNIP
jgi:hypothetical protein